MREESTLMRPIGQACSINSILLDLECDSGEGVGGKAEAGKRNSSSCQCEVTRCVGRTLVGETECDWIWVKIVRL